MKEQHLNHMSVQGNNVLLFIYGDTSSIRLRAESTKGDDSWAERSITEQRE